MGATGEQLKMTVSSPTALEGTSEALATTAGAARAVAAHAATHLAPPVVGATGGVTPADVGGLATGVGMLQQVVGDAETEATRGAVHARSGQEAPALATGGGGGGGGDLMHTGRWVGHAER